MPKYYYLSVQPGGVRGHCWRVLLPLPAGLVRGRQKLSGERPAPAGQRQGGTTQLICSPLHCVGQVSGELNGVRLAGENLHCYVEPGDGKTYTAISNVPPEIGWSMQVLICRPESH